MPIRPTAVLALPLVLAAGACHSSPPAQRGPASTLAPRLDRSHFPGAVRLLDGHDATPPTAVWQSGDRVLFALQLTRGETTHRWLMHLEVLVGDVVSGRLDDGTPAAGEWFGRRTWRYTTEFGGERREHTLSSRMRPVVVRICDADGKQLGQSLVQMPADLLDAGLLRSIDAAAQLFDTDAQKYAATAEDDAKVGDIVRGALALVALLGIVQEDSVLADYFWQVVEKPSIWSVVTGFGVSASLTTAFEQSLPATSLPDGMPPQERAYVTPLRVEVNGGTALLADVLAIGSRRPYALCGGMIAATARHPSRSDVRLDVQLLAARLGKERQSEKR